MLGKRSQNELLLFAEILDLIEEVKYNLSPLERNRFFNDIPRQEKKIKIEPQVETDKTESLLLSNQYQQKQYYNNQFILPEIFQQFQQDGILPQPNLVNQVFISFHNFHFLF